LSNPLNNTPEASDPERHFRTDHLEADLKGRSIRGGAVTMAAQLGKFILRLAVTVILARLLTPKDYGLIGMVTVITNFVALFQDLGLSLATIQRSKIDHAQVSTLFWLNVALSCGLTLLIVALAPAIAWFYGEPRLIWITIVLAVGFVFGGLTVQHQALLRRQMRFKALAALEIISMLVGFVAGLVWAWYRRDYWSLVVLQQTQIITTAVGVWVMCGWRPGPPVRHSGIGSMLVFGGNFTGFTVVNYFSRNLDNVLIGSYLGAEQLGLYAKAYQLLLLPIQQINMPLRNVAIPTLSRLQHDPDRYRAYYHKAVQLMVTFGMPLVAFTFVTADNLLPTLLGPQWTNTVSIFQVLSVAAFLGTFNMATGWVYVSFGRTDIQFRWNLFASAVTAIGFFIGIKWGTLGVAAAYSISQVLLQIPAIVYSYKDSPLRLRDLAITLSRPAFASLSAAAALFALNHFLLNNINGLISLLLDGVLYILFYIGLWILLPNGRHEFLDILRLLKDVRQKPKKSQNTD